MYGRVSVTNLEGVRRSRESILASSLRNAIAASLSVSLALCPAVFMGSKRKYYAVVTGHQPGVYETWEECERQVKGFKGGLHKSFPSVAEAEQYIQAERSKKPMVMKVAAKVESRQLQQGSLKFPVVSTKSKGSKAAVVSNPFKSYAMQTSSSVLDMAPADYEDCVDPCKTEPSLDRSAEAVSSLQTPTQLTIDRDFVSDVVYQLEYDGASKGNPGAAGAGALLRHPDGTVVSEVSVGLGKATNNVAEYRGLIEGMRRALDIGIQRIKVQGDSKLVTMQVMGKWKINNPNLAVLCKEAVQLGGNFKEFQIRHVDREYNSAADVLANKGVSQVEEVFKSSFSGVKKKLETK